MRSPVRRRVVILGVLATAGSLAACGAFGGSDDSSSGATTAPSDAGTRDDGSSASSASPANDARVDPAKLKLVFALRAQHDSDTILRGAADDAACTQELRTVRPAADAVAWLVLGGKSPLERLGAGERAWGSPFGDVVFATTAELVVGARTGIAWTVDGVAAGGEVWTGVFADGGAGPDCNGWTKQSATLDAVVGQLGAPGPRWTEKNVVDCSGSLSVLCFER